MAIRDGLAFGGCAADGCGSLAFVARVLAASVLIFWVFCFFFFGLGRYVDLSLRQLQHLGACCALVSWSVWLSENDMEDVPKKRLDCLIEKRANYASVA